MSQTEIKMEPYEVNGAEKGMLAYYHHAYWSHETP